MPALNQSLARGVGSQEGDEVSLPEHVALGKHWVLQGERGRDEVDE